MQFHAGQCSSIDAMKVRGQYDGDEDDDGITREGRPRWTIGSIKLKFAKELWPLRHLRAASHISTGFIYCRSLHQFKDLPVQYRWPNNSPLRCHVHHSIRFDAINTNMTIYLAEIYLRTASSFVDFAF